MGVQPWEREILAREDMQLTTDPLEAATDDHIYFSKEASSGGRGFGGGGCGCCGASTLRGSPVSTEGIEIGESRLPRETE